MAVFTSASEPLRLVPFDQVEMDDGIWKPRILTLVRETLPHAFTQTEVAQRRLRLCAEWLESGGVTPKPEPHRFNTSDLYKVMEGAAYMIKAEPNPEIEELMDRIIDVIARAQLPDGYLYVAHITGSINEREMGVRPYSHVIHSHELYNVGHLYEAAVAYARATGKTKLLEVAEKSAVHVNKVFFEGDPNYNDGQPVNQAPGHQEIELGLVKLFEQTGNHLYLEMAKRFLDIRGVTFVPDGEGVDSASYAQQHAPVAEQMEAVGHAVRATYQYAAMAEIDSLLGTDSYSRALNGIWHDIVDRKMHLIGGLGAIHGIEGFGPAYLLPNKDTYLETCAAVGSVFFNMRMFLKYREARYLDVAEIALLNNSLAGIGLDGKSFFYPNPLEADEGHAPRAGWFGTACCPSNIARLIPQVSGYMYATAGNDLYCALYGQNRAKVEMATGDVELIQRTDYPWSGAIEIEVNPGDAVQFRLHLRIPTWTGEKLVPGELYSYREPSSGWTIEVNEELLQVEVENGFAVIDRTWRREDLVRLNLPMPVKVNTCTDLVEANRDRIAFSRGPIVLAAEGVDNGGDVRRLFVDPQVSSADAKIVFSSEGPLAGLPMVSLAAREVTLNGESASSEVRLIPYFAWSNRDRSSMITWIPTREAMARPDPRSKGLKFAGARASHTFHGDSIEAVRLRTSPASSRDESIPRWTSWPETGRTQWVEIEFEEESDLVAAGVYFFDDGRGVAVPGSWHLEVPEGDRWREVAIYNTDQYSSLPDTYNTVRPAAFGLRTRKIRIVMTPKSGNVSVGILSVQIETR